MYTEWTYGVYVAVSLSLTVWVARTLFKNGRIFLVDAFSGNEALADAVNHLLVVGFYLINVGFVALALRYGDKPSDLASAIEFGSTKIGLVLMVVGVMHFFNLYLFSQARQRGLGRARRPAEAAGAGQAPRPPMGMGSQRLARRGKE